jgi:FKBP-type peptidyl-prolyl cis-trans isomerase FkpA
MRKETTLLLLTLSLAAPARAEDPKAQAKPAAKPAAASPAAAKPAAATGGLTTEGDKTLYALGLVISRNLSTFALNESELKHVQEGISDGTLAKAPKVDIETYGPKIQEFAKARQSAAAEGEKKVGAAFLTTAAAWPGASKKPSGIVYQEVTAGTGASPKATDQVKVHYTGSLIDGTVFDSSVTRGQPATFPLNGVIKCWTEGVQLMKVGGKAKLVCPSDLAYGDGGSPPKIKPGSTLVFDVELLEIVAPPAK